MSNHNHRIALTAAVVKASMAFCLAAGIAGVQPATVVSLASDDSYGLTSDDAVDPVADCLTAQGYHGLAGDGKPVIYAPAAAIEHCAAVSK